MNTLKQSQGRMTWVWQGRLSQASWSGKLSSRFVTAINRFTTMLDEQDDRDGQRTFEDRLQHTGRIRYR